MSLSTPLFAAALAIPLSLPAAAQDRATLGNDVAPMATTDPQIMIYRVAGVVDSGSDLNLGTATAFMCYNNSSTAENVRFRLLNWNGAVSADKTMVIPSKRTRTATTHLTLALLEDLSLAPGTPITQGSAGIIATNKDIYCSAMIVNASAVVPSGIALHMVRFNPQPGTVE